MKKFAFAGAFTLLLAFGSPAQSATAVTGNFTIANGNPSASGGTVTFVLNANGTISASLASTSGSILGFGFDSSSLLAESGFSPTTPDNTVGWADLYGDHASGFYCGACGTTESWTIGTLGQFSDVFDALSGSGSQYDFFLYTANGTQWAANAQVAPAAVPEPGTWATMLLGLGAVGFALRRRKTRQSSVALSRPQWA